MPRQRNEDPIKFCERCGVRLQRKRYGKNLEDFAAFLSRRYCSLKCSNSRGITTDAGYRSEARKMRTDQCEACGYLHELQVHHKNGNYKDNSPENLQTLCIYCHTFWHATLDRMLLKCQGMPILFSPEEPTQQSGTP